MFGGWGGVVVFVCCWKEGVAGDDLWWGMDFMMCMGMKVKVIRMFVTSSLIITNVLSRDNASQVRDKLYHNGSGLVAVLDVNGSRDKLMLARLTGLKIVQ